MVKILVDGVEVKLKALDTKTSRGNTYYEARYPDGQFMLKFMALDGAGKAEEKPAEEVKAAVKPRVVKKSTGQKGDGVSDEDLRLLAFLKAAKAAGQL